MGRLFGTDGVRGLANAELTPELALAVAVAAARVLAESRPQPPAAGGRRPGPAGQRRDAGGGGGGRPDQRRRRTWSGSACCPPPRWRSWSAEAEADLGVMLSASHNPMPDNGIKLFAAGGHKLPDEIEERIEAAVTTATTGWARPTGAGIGRVHDLLDGAEHYVQHLVGATPHRWTGSRSWSTARTARRPTVAADAYREAGAEVIAIHAEPDGLNINDNCGSTHLEAVRGRGPPTRRRPGHRPRRRRRPVPGGRPPTATRSTATRSWRSWRWPCATPAR